MTERLFLRLPEDALCAPETTVPPHTLINLPVHSSVRRFVASSMAYDEWLPDGHEAVERVLPDGAARLLIEVHSAGVAVRVAGASAKSVVLSVHGHVHGLSVTLRPGAIPALFGVSAVELADRVVPWEELAAREHCVMPERLAMAANDAVRAEIIFESLREMSVRADPKAQQLLEHALARLRADAGSMRIGELSTSMGLSERRLQQVFASQLGLSPRAWRRVQRLHETLRMLRNVRAPQWALIALRAGYYDQSHLINEFRALCGVTPEQFRLRVVSGSSNTKPRPRS